MRYLHFFMQHLIDNCPSIPPQWNRLLYGIYGQCFLSQLNGIKWKYILNYVQWNIFSGWKNCISKNIYLLCSWAVLLGPAKPQCQCVVYINLSFPVGGILVIVWKHNSQPLLWPFWCMSEHNSKVSILEEILPSSPQYSRPSLSYTSSSFHLTLSSPTPTYCLSPSARGSVPRGQWFCFVHGCISSTW